MPTTVMNQDSEYEEESTVENYEEESGEDTAAPGMLFGIPVKILIIGGAVFLVLLILILVVKFRSNNESTYIPDNSTSNVQQQAPVEFLTWTDASGNVVGGSYGMDEGTAISSNGVVYGRFSSTGTIQVQSNTGLIAYVNPDVPQNTVQQPAQQPSHTTPDQMFESTDSTVSTDDRTMLKQLGYSGDEIDLAISQGLSINDLVEAAQKLRDAEAAEALKRMSDSASEEFQYLLNYSIFSQEYQEFQPYNTEVEWESGLGSYVVNADYEKLDTYGYQLYIKLKIANSTYAYMAVSPDRWSVLPASGNMVVRINYMLWGERSNPGIYITNVSEVDVTQITVNPEDSTQSLSEIIGLGE